MRFGLCCLFKNEAVSFRTVTAKTLSALPRETQLFKLSSICLDNTKNLLLALETVHNLGIGAFRIMSPLFPRMTHPDVGYSLDALPDGETISFLLSKIRLYAKENDIRLSFHPDQFVVLSSPHKSVVDNSIRELLYQSKLAEAVGADVINIHAGGVYGDKPSALQRFSDIYTDLPESVKSRLTLENDDISYTVSDLLPICKKLSIPLVYDVHHHRCNPDDLTTAQATELTGELWHAAGREQYCHLSSPVNGWDSRNTRPHADYINPADFPECWLGRHMTIDIEAKFKELAVVQLINDLSST